MGPGLGGVEEEGGGLCLGLEHVLVSLVLVAMIGTNVVGNLLVIGSIVHYKRMRTFTNVLLLSLASADTLVGILVTPIALLDLLHGHAWPFSPLLCKLWATTDVLLCTASILNLCVISLDRYFAITSPLKYTSTRSGRLAAGLICAVWALSVVVCSPPLFVPDWKDDPRAANSSAPLVCGYTRSVSYRIYSASGSFYIPLFVMLFVYFRIFRVASSREAALSQALPSRAAPGTGPGSEAWYSRGALRSRAEARLRSSGRAAPRSGPQANLRHRGAAALNARSGSVCYTSNNQSLSVRMQRGFSIDVDLSEEVCQGLASRAEAGSGTGSGGGAKGPLPSVSVQEASENGEENRTPLLSPSLGGPGRAAGGGPAEADRLSQAGSQSGRASPGYYAGRKELRGSRERMMYAKERKALKTIAVVVIAFVTCWLPFFVFYLVELWLPHSLALGVFGDIFLWLGYSNSVLNPIIYTMYNSDFRRCFRDLVSCGPCRHSLATFSGSHVAKRMSVRRLHQTRL